MLTHYIPEK